MNMRMPKHGDVLDLTPTEIDDDGLAVARFLMESGPERRRVRAKIRGAIPGDRVEARVESRVRDDLFMRVATLTTPSPDRITPTCRHAVYDNDRTFCGGCTLQAVSYERQLTLKRERVERAFGVAHVPLEVLPTIPAPTTFGHRHKMELSFAPELSTAPAADAAPVEVALGMHPPGYKWEVVSLAECPLLSPASSAFMPRLEAIFRGRGLRAWDPRRDDSFLRNLIIREAKRTSEILIELITTPLDPVATNDGPQSATAIVDALFADIAEAFPAATSLLWTVQDAERGRPTRFHTKVLRGTSGLTDQLVIRDRTLTLDIDARAFFQPHPRAAEGLVHVVLDRLGQARTVLDLYCGTGTLALSLAPFVGRVVGVEIVAEAITNARANATRNALDNATFIVGDVGVVVADPAFRASIADLDAIVLDPPRSGLSPQALDAVTALSAPRLVYVSCKPESLARDLRALTERGYRFEGAAQPVDMFPQSHHIETVVSLVR